MPKSKRGESGSLSKYKRQKLQRLYTWGGAAYGSVHSLVEASNLPLSKVREFLRSKRPYTKFTLTTRKFEKLKAFARFRNKIWCMDVAYVDKLAKKNGVRYLLVRHGLFDGTVDAKRKKTKIPRRLYNRFQSWLQRRILARKLGLTWGQSLMKSLKNFVMLKENKSTPQWVRPRLNLLNIQYDH